MSTRTLGHGEPDSEHARSKSSRHLEQFNAALPVADINVQFRQGHGRFELIRLKFQGALECQPGRGKLAQPDQGQPRDGHGLASAGSLVADIRYSLERQVGPPIGEICSTFDNGFPVMSTSG